MGKPKAPKAPDPKETASAQTATNVSTALANAQLGNVNQYGPDGSVTYSQNGGQWITDPTSNARYFIPQYEQKTQLSSQQQAIKEQEDAANLNLGKIAANQSGFLNDYLSKPVNLNNEATEARLMELGRKRLDPMIAQRDEDLRTRLANQGIKAGSDAFAREMDTFNQGTNDAYNQLLLNGRQQAVQEALSERNQPLNEIGALLSGSQVSMPSFGAGTNQPSIPTVDYAGLVNQNYQNQLGAYNQANAQRQGMLGGLFGIGAAFAGNPAIKFSDRRLKKDIKPVGRLMGHKLYSYTYKGSDVPQVGVMAQDVAKKRPDAVINTDSGMKAVNYGKLFGLGEKVAA
jgi:hypothetical protein